MGTRSRIGIRNSDDSVDSIYCHWDGYPSHNGRLLITHYTDENKIRELMALGDISSLAPEIGKQQDFDKPTNKDWCVAYGRDRGEEDCEAEHSASVQDYLNISCGAAYYYIFHYGRWMVWATYGEDEGRWVLVEEVLGAIPPVIKPVNNAGDYCTGELTNIKAAEINRRLGFKPNIQDDPNKVKYSWGFTVDGERCGVWDYKGSYRDGEFSTWGPADALRKVFGEHYKPRREWG